MNKGIQFHDEEGNKLYPNPFPIGSVFITITNKNPEEYFGGKWISFGQGKCLVGVDPNDSTFNSVLKTGGSKYLQSHSHKLVYGSDTGSPVNISYGPGNNGVLNLSSWQWVSADTPGNFYAQRTGDGNSGNLQPFITVYMWYRSE
jgi:hypothetical protein